MTPYMKQRQIDKIFGKPPKDKKQTPYKKSSIKNKRLPTSSKPGMPYLELLKLAQLVFNRWIRNRDQGKPCVTCPSIEPSEAGHFYSAGSFSGVRFDETNVHIQCGVCNRGKDGNHKNYIKAMVRMYGAAYMAELEELARSTKMKSWSREELEHIIAKYKL